jgi:NADP-dependent 3-hydroxy acid dehydrogenase YdfG
VFELDGRVAVVTGASSGLGERFARVLHAAGANVVVTARRAGHLAALVDELGVDSAASLAGDVRDDAHLDALVELALNRFGRIDVVVANAGARRFAAVPRQRRVELCHRPHAHRRRRLDRLVNELAELGSS